MGYWDAHKHCASLGAHLATRDELEELRKTYAKFDNRGSYLAYLAYFRLIILCP